MKYIFILLSLFCIFSCHHDKSQTDNVINADLDSKENVSIFQFFKSIELIPLESSEEALIAQISKMLQHDTVIYVLDKKQGFIFLFNNKGKFIKKINRKGRGPGEYSFIYDMKLNPYNCTLEVLDPMGQLLIFSLEGEYLQRLKLPYPPTAYREFSIINEDLILFYCMQEAKSLCLFSRKQNKIINDFYEEAKEYTTYNPVRCLFQYKDTTYFCRGISDVVYKFSGDNVIPAYEWDFGKYRFNPRDYISFDESKGIKTIMKESESLPYRYNYNFQNDKYLCTSIQKNKQIVNIFFDKRNHQSLVFHKTIEGVLFLPHIFSDSIVLVKVEPEITCLRDFVKEDMLAPKDVAILNGITEDSNPVLIKYHFK